MKKVFIFSLLVVLYAALCYSQSAAGKVNWMGFAKAVEKNKTTPKKIFIKVFASWCGYCKKMDDSTFTNKTIADYINKNFYAVKLNAESLDTMYFNGKMYVNPNPTVYRSKHQLASELLKGRLVFPSVVFLDEKLNEITLAQGYLLPKELEPYLKWVGENFYLKTIYEDFLKSFKGEIN